MADIRPLPNLEAAVIEDSKLEAYALNSESERGQHKARLFARVLGFTQGNWRQLRQALLDALPSCDAVALAENSFGQKYVVIVPVTGPNGNTAEVTTVWQYDRLPNGVLSDAPRLVTLYLR